MMKVSKLVCSLPIVCLLGAVLLSGLEAQSTAQGPTDERKRAAVIARVWHGRTRANQADEYFAYLNEAGIKKIQAITGNLGVQVFRRAAEDVTEFTVISYWESLDAIRRFAGDDIEKTHPLPRDPEYLLELEPTVKHHQVLLNDWNR